MKSLVDFFVGGLFGKFRGNALYSYFDPAYRSFVLVLDGGLKFRFVVPTSRFFYKNFFIFFVFKDFSVYSLEAFGSIYRFLNLKKFVLFGLPLFKEKVFDSCFFSIFNFDFFFSNFFFLGRSCIKSLFLERLDFFLRFGVFLFFGNFFFFFRLFCFLFFYLIFNFYFVLFFFFFILVAFFFQFFVFFYFVFFLHLGLLFSFFFYKIFDIRLCNLVSSFLVNYKLQLKLIFGFLDFFGLGNSFFRHVYFGFLFDRSIYLNLVIHFIRWFKSCFFRLGRRWRLLSFFFTFFLKLFCWRDFNKLCLLKFLILFFNDLFKYRIKLGYNIFFVTRCWKVFLPNFVWINPYLNGYVFSDFVGRFKRFSSFFVGKFFFNSWKSCFFSNFRFKLINLVRLLSLYFFALFYFGFRLLFFFCLFGFFKSCCNFFFLFFVKFFYFFFSLKKFIKNLVGLYFVLKRIFSRNSVLFGYLLHYFFFFQKKLGFVSFFKRFLLSFSLFFMKNFLSKTYSFSFFSQFFRRFFDVQFSFFNSFFMFLNVILSLVYRCLFGLFFYYSYWLIYYMGYYYYFIKEIFVLFFDSRYLKAFKFVDFFGHLNLLKERFSIFGSLFFLKGLTLRDFFLKKVDLKFSNIFGFVRFNTLNFKRTSILNFSRIFSIDVPLFLRDFNLVQKGRYKRILIGGRGFYRFYKNKSFWLIYWLNRLRKRRILYRYIPDQIRFRRYFSWLYRSRFIRILRSERFGSHPFGRKFFWTFNYYVPYRVRRWRKYRRFYLRGVKFYKRGSGYLYDDIKSCLKSYF